MRTPVNIPAVAESVRGAPSTEIHRCCQQLNISETLLRRILHKNWGGGCWQHLASTGRFYVPYIRRYTQCFAPSFLRSHFHQSWCCLTTSELRFDTVRLLFVLRRQARDNCCFKNNFVKPLVPVEWNYFPLLTGRIIFLNKKEIWENIQQVFLNLFQKKKKLFGRMCTIKALKGIIGSEITNESHNIYSIKLHWKVIVNLIQIPHIYFIWLLQQNTHTY